MEKKQPEREAQSILSRREFYDCRLSDVVKLNGLHAGMVIHFEFGPPVLVGDCTPYCRPTNNNGGIGWDFNSDYGKMRVVAIDYYTVPSYTNCQRDCSPQDFRGSS